MIKSIKSILLSVLVMLAVMSWVTTQETYAEDMDSPLKHTPTGTIIEITRDIIFAPNQDAVSITIASTIPTHYRISINKWGGNNMYKCDKTGNANLHILARMKTKAMRKLRAGTKLTIVGVSKAAYLKQKKHILSIDITLSHKSIRNIVLEFPDCAVGDPNKDDYTECINSSFKAKNPKIKDLEGKLFGNYFKIVSIAEMEEM